MEIGIFSIIIVACIYSVAFVRSAAIDTVVENVSAEMNEQNCRLPKEIGRCYASFIRFAYNQTNDECEEFLFGGCNPNANNFKTKEACEAKCKNIARKDVVTESTTDSATEDNSTIAATTSTVLSE